MSSCAHSGRWLCRLATLLVLAAATVACKEEGTIRVTKITFEGAEHVPAKRLKTVIATKESSRLPWGRKRFFDRNRNWNWRGFGRTDYFVRGDFHLRGRHFLESIRVDERYAPARQLRRTLRGHHDEFERVEICRSFDHHTLLMGPGIRASTMHSDTARAIGMDEVMSCMSPHQKGFGEVRARVAGCSEKQEEEL